MLYQLSYSRPSHQTNSKDPFEKFRLVGRGGFEPPKASPSDLQSDPFDHSGTSPYLSSILPEKVLPKPQSGAGERTRTSDMLITNQLLYQLSYASQQRRCKIGVTYEDVKPYGG